MHKSLFAVARFIGYWASAIVGWLTHIFLAVPFQAALGPLSRTRLGRGTFVIVSRTRARPLWLVLIAFVMVLPLHLNSWAAAGLALTLVALGRLLYNFHGRILLVSNNGAASWTVHMNLLKAGNPAMIWKGLFEELDNLIQMAESARITTLKFQSPLLVNDATARLLQAKLTRILANHGRAAQGLISEPDPMGVLGTGLIHVYLMRQKGLKSKRQDYHCAPWNLNTRKIKVKIAPAPSPSLSPAPSGYITASDDNSQPAP